MSNFIETLLMGYDDESADWTLVSPGGIESLKRSAGRLGAPCHVDAA